jgi:hypothetical protein
MKAIDFETIIKDITGNDLKVRLLENQDAKKWYEKIYVKCDIITEQTIYGIFFDGHIIYDFKLGKIESLLKTFITQYVNKHLVKTCYLKDGNIINHTKETAFKTLSNIQPRNAFMCAYSTNYGVGTWNIYIPLESKKLLNDTIKSILINKGIEFKNEFSEAGWVYRHKFSGNYQDHNLIIDEIKTTLTN